MPKVIDHEQRRRDIVEVAKKLILEGGFEAATMRSIASEAGFANGALKHYFPGKETIVAATFESVLAEMSEALSSPMADADELQQLRSYLEGSLPLDEHRVNSGRVLLALWEYAMSNTDLADLYRRHLTGWQAQLVTLIRRARQSTGVKLEQTDEQLATEVISVTIGSNVMSLMYPGGEKGPDYQAYVDHFIERLSASVDVV
ncbi:TetR/AcrR family transcriptional regulator [Subtercola sp. YIM 133946]|uniref:TetR/AcrR family transcriptional regulator n=1 Tax=Subtercola sp. YIM 133946 TaxID=3118909 RepID=UPI002F92936A